MSDYMQEKCNHWGMQRELQSEENGLGADKMHSLLSFSFIFNNYFIFII